MARIFSLLLAVITLCAAATLPAATPVPDQANADELSLSKCMRISTERDRALWAAAKEGKALAPEWSALDRACLHYKMAQAKLPRHPITLLNLSPDNRVAQCIDVLFAIAPDGTLYEFEFKGKGCGLRSLKCAIHLTLAATDGTHEKHHEEYASGLTALITHETGQWLALTQGQFACYVQDDENT